MSWGKSSMDAKREFVMLANQPGVNRRELCRRFGVSHTAGYELLQRYRDGGEDGLRERSRRPSSSPAETSNEMQQLIVSLRDETHWGARKISHRLRQLGYRDAPPRSTVNNILRRHGRIHPTEASRHQPFHRFEHEQPNQLWQMDFKGWFDTPEGRCHPLTVLDDHSRFSVVLRACENETTETVRNELTRAFRLYGLPWRITADNGSPWGDDGEGRLTKIGVWLIRVGVRLTHSRPYHPQTQGKDERFHKTLDGELLNHVTLRDLAGAQRSFDRWRDRYNLERPHEALAMKTPAERYRPSERAFPETLPSIDYDQTDTIRKVDPYGKIKFKGRTVHVGKGCSGLPVALRPSSAEGVFDVFFCHQKLTSVDLNNER